MKVAFDENVPVAMVRVFQTFANERQLRKLIASVEVTSAKDYPIMAKRGSLWLLLPATCRRQS